MSIQGNVKTLARRIQLLYEVNELVNKMLYSMKKKTWKILKRNKQPPTEKVGLLENNSKQYTKKSVDEVYRESIAP